MLLPTPSSTSTDTLFSSTPLFRSSTFLLLGVIILFCLVFSMFSIYGGRASNIGTACLLAMVFSIEGTRDVSQALEYAAFMLSGGTRSEEHTSELPSLMRIPYDVFCYKHKINRQTHPCF